MTKLTCVMGQAHILNY